MDHNTGVKSPNEFNAMSGASFDYRGWREGFLLAVLRAASLAGLILGLVSFSGRTPASRIFFIVIYLMVLLAAFLPRLNYRVRAGFLLLLIFGIGLRALFGLGFGADANIFFVAFAALAALLFESNIDLMAVGASLVAIATAGILNLTGQFQTGNASAWTAVNWLFYGFDFAALALVAIWPIRLFKREFSAAAEKAGKTLEALSSERAQLKEQVQGLAQDSEKQAVQLRASALITRQIADIKDVQPMLAQVATLIGQQLGHYHVGIFLLDELTQTAFLQASSSEDGQALMERGYQVDVDERNIIGRVAATRRLIIVADTGNPEFPLNDPDMPRTHSRIALPLIARGKAIGVLDIHSEASQAFGQIDAEINQLLADQVAASIENVRLMNETQAVITELEILTAQQTQSAWKGYLERNVPAFQFTPTGIRQVAPNAKNKTNAGLNIPLLLRGERIGSIALQRKNASHWTDVERDLAEKIASQVALALENSRLIEETRRYAAQQQSVGEISARLSRSLDVDTLLQTAARELGSLPNIAEVSVFIGGQDPKDNHAGG